MKKWATYRGCMGVAVKMGRQFQVVSLQLQSMQKIPGFCLVTFHKERYGGISAEICVKIEACMLSL